MKSVRNLTLSFLALCALCLTACPLQAGEAGEAARSDSLVGIWQQMSTRKVKGLKQVGYELFFKILNADGTFCNVSILSNGQAVYSQRGTYEVLDDEYYIEHIEYSPIARFNETSNRLRYSFQRGGKRMVLLWYNPSVDCWVPELWQRVGDGPAQP